MPAVTILGLDGPLGRRIERRLQRSDDPDGLRVVIDVGACDHDARALRRESATEFAAASIAAADATQADHLVFVSSALVFGAAPGNPVPLTEDSIVTPDVDFVFARQLATAEELVDDWRRSRPGRTTAVLRPALSMAADSSSRLTSALVAGFGRRFALDDPPAQFLHLDDLASAVELAVTARLDGVYNVAPDGWIPGARVRALSGEKPRLPLPERVAEVLWRVRWQFQRGPIPPGLKSYTEEPWVIANGRLRACGWVPNVTNEQAYVEGTEAPWWTVVSPKRRQELALGAGVVVGAIALAVGAGVTRRIRARRRRGRSIRS
jgi:nucleoside-diphosphate-sugar epimerase